MKGQQYGANVRVAKSPRIRAGFAQPGTVKGAQGGASQPSKGPSGAQGSAIARGLMKGGAQGGQSQPQPKGKKNLE
jgi:hypothetical protein